MIIAISNQKGGVNKTTLTFNLGYILAEQGKKTLIVDADPQSSLSTIINITTKLKNIYNVLLEQEPIQNAIVEVDSNLHLLQGDIALANFEINVATMKGREFYFKEILKQVKSNYDYILIDSPPSLGLLLINILNASDGVIIPTHTDYLSYKGMELLLHTIARAKETFNKQLKIIGIVATNYDSRTLHSKEILDLLQEEFNIMGTVAVSTKVKDATLAGKPLHRYDNNHKIVTEYRRIAREVLEYGK